MRRSKTFAFPALVFVASIVLYICTMPPSIAAVGYAADTLKFQYIGKVFGTPHFGYPTYMFLNILFSRLPFFNLAYRLNLLSAFLASATLVMLYFIIHSLIRHHFVAVVSALVFGVTYTFWENSIIAEVYSLNTLFTCSVLLLMLKWGETKNSVFFYLACMIYALSFGNHLIQITLLPALVYWTFAVDRAVLFQKRTYILVSAFILLGASQYGYVLLRSYQVPPPESVFQDWPHFEDFGRTHMEVYARSLPDLIDQVSGGRWKERLAQHPSAEAVHDRISFFRNLFLLQFSPAGLFLGTTGIGLALLRDRKRAVFLLLALTAHLAFVTTWGIPGIDVHLIPGYLILCIFIAYNVELFTLSWFSRHKNAHRVGQTCVAGLIALLMLFLVASRYRNIDQSKNVWLATMMNNVLPEIPDDSIIFTNHVYATAFWYKLYGEESRPDARITVYPVWKIHKEDLRYALGHYRQVFYFLDEPYWPTLEHMGVNYEVVTFSNGSLYEYLKQRTQGEIVALYADIDNRESAQNLAHIFDMFGFPPPEPGVIALIGVVQDSGVFPLLTGRHGSLSVKYGTRFGTVTMPSYIHVLLAPREEIYVDNLSCSRYRKMNNTVFLDPSTGKVNSMMYVDWKRNAAIDPVYLLLVRTPRRS